ncbi:MAG: hypothetical protein II122_05370 [Bacteroidaceae bacterium]|jgi:hypothetical protein|nr:hypothetical protein [Bacteroidaceae bacterium]HAE24968.1 hypothetical protein [Prevotellaceae bacterium]
MKKKTKPRKNQAKPKITPATILASAEAKVYYKKAIKAGLLDKDYNVTCTYRLFAYFASRLSEKLGITKRRLADGSLANKWKPYEVKFGIKKGTLREGRKSMIKEKGTFTPKGYQIVDRMFKIK